MNSILEGLAEEEGFEFSPEMNPEIQKFKRLVSSADHLKTLTRQVGFFLKDYFCFF